MVVIEGYNNKYKITEEGEVISSMWKKAKVLKPQRASQSKKGYFQVRLFNEKYPKGKLQYVHRLVWETFKGEIPEGKEIDHIDGDTTNNSIDNLQLLTPRNNKTKYYKGKDTHWREYRDEFIEHYKKLGSYKKVAKIYDINPNIVFRVIKDVVHKIDWSSGERKTHTVRYNPDLKDYYTETDFRKDNIPVWVNRKRDEKGRFMSN
jgi:hypothetical protein